MENAIKIDAAQAEQLAKARATREHLLHSICAYYAPDRVCFGKASKCLSCCCGAQREYDPSVEPFGDDDKPCKRWKTVRLALPGDAKGYF